MVVLVGVIFVVLLIVDVEAVVMVVQLYGYIDSIDLIVLGL